MRLHWAGAAIAVVLAIAVGWLVGSWLRRRVREQCAAADQIAEGDFSARAPALERDEIGALGRALNQIAERQASQIETLKTNRDELETVLDSVADGLIAIDAEDRITHMNPESIRMFDAHREMVGHPFWEVVRDAPLADLVAQVKQDLRPAEGSLTLAHPPPRRDLEVRVSPKKRSSEGWQGAVLAFRDVTLLHRLEAVRRDFVANVSHEMKTPLTSIQGYVETLQGGAIDDGQIARDFLEKIDRNARNLGHLVSDLLVLSRVEAGGIQVEAEPFPVFTVVSEAAA